LTPAAAFSKRTTMTVKAQIAEKLAGAFAPQKLEVIDESHQHEGHAGHRPGGETHFRVHIVSDAFRGKSRIERHRMVNQTLSSELASGVHALAIHASAPGEPGVGGQ
jgi:BolA protein